MVSGLAVTGDAKCDGVCGDKLLVVFGIALALGYVAAILAERTR